MTVHDNILLILIDCVLFEATVEPDRIYIGTADFLKRMAWLTLSKAFDKSHSVRSDISLLFMFPCIAPVTFKRAHSLEGLGLKPC